MFFGVTGQNKMIWISLISCWALVIFSALNGLKKLGWLSFFPDRIAFSCLFALLATTVIFSTRAWFSARRSVQISIQSWDPSLRKDIDKFFFTRQWRLQVLSTVLFVVFLIYAVLEFAKFTRLPGSAELAFYFYFGILFHFSWVLTFLVFKLQRTLMWVRMENRFGSEE